MNWKPGRKSPRRLGRGIDPPKSGQHRGRANRRAVAKANGRVVEIGSHKKLISGTIGDAKSDLALLDGQSRWGRTGQ